MFRLALWLSYVSEEIRKYSSSDSEYNVKGHEVAWTCVFPQTGETGTWGGISLKLNPRIRLCKCLDDVNQVEYRKKASLSSYKYRCECDLHFIPVFLDT